MAALQALDGRSHAEHEKWIVKMGGFRIEKREGFVRLA